MTLSVPAIFLKIGAMIERIKYGDAAKLTPDRVRYFCHPDWVCKARPPQEIWQATIKAAEGLKATADWYRQQGWL
jgi:hypothetical protein